MKDQRVITIGLLETMACCSSCSHDSSFVVRVGSRNGVWLRACLCVFFFEGALPMQECATALELWGRRGSGEKNVSHVRSACRSWEPEGYGRWEFFFSFFLC